MARFRVRTGADRVPALSSAPWGDMNTALAGIGYVGRGHDRAGPVQTGGYRGHRGPGLGVSRPGRMLVRSRYHHDQGQQDGQQRRERSAT